MQKSVPHPLSKCGGRVIRFDGPLLLLSRDVYDGGITVMEGYTY